MHTEHVDHACGGEAVERQVQAVVQLAGDECGRRRLRLGSPVGQFELIVGAWTRLGTCRDSTRLSVAAVRKAMEQPDRQAPQRGHTPSTCPLDQPIHSEQTYSAEFGQVRHRLYDSRMSQTGEALSRLRKALVAAQTEFVQGNAKPFKSLWSHGEDVSIFGAFGGFEQGWSLVGARLDWASSASSALRLSWGMGRSGSSRSCG
jgi:hypothetical protein